MGRLLRYTRTGGYRHTPTPAGAQAIKTFGYDVDHFEDDLADLGDYGAAAFLSTSDDILTEAGSAIIPLAGAQG